MNPLKKAIRSLLVHAPSVYDALTSQSRYLAYYRLGLVHDRDFRALPRLVNRRDPVVLDVGANNGQSILSIKRVLPEARVVSFEPNRAHTDDLVRLQHRFEDVQVKWVGLAAEAGELDLYWPVYNDRPMLALASIDRSQASGFLGPHTLYGYDERRLSIAHERCRVVTLDSLGLTPDVIKIDTQGTEADVIAGGVATISRYKPTILVESLPDETWRILKAMGYKRLFAHGRSLVEDARGKSETILVAD